MVPYPIFLNLRDCRVLVVGGGSVALRKAGGLIPTGARVVVVAPAFHADFAALAGKVTMLDQPYEPAILPGAPRFTLVFAATGDSGINAAVCADASAHGILCARADDPEDSDFTNGAALQVPGLSVAVSTHGASPALAARIRDEIAAGLDPMLPQWSGLMAGWRAEAHRLVGQSAARRALLMRLAGTEMEAILRAGGEDVACKAADAWIQAAAKAGRGESP